MAHELSSPLCSLFDQFLSLGAVPDIWKEVHVGPIPKGGDRTAVSNYRPISLLSNINKGLERIVFKHLYNHFLENDILTPLQSGFIPGDSAVNQLLFLYNTFCKALDAGKEVRVNFCHISKAFDRVWHAGLIHVLRAAGIFENLLDLVFQLSLQTWTESCTTWSSILMDLHLSRCPKRFYIRTIMMI